LSREFTVQAECFFWQTQRGNVNEKRIQQVLEIEKKAEEIRAKAAAEAELIPVSAEQAGQDLIAKARTSAQEEANQMIAKAKAEQESATILADTDEHLRRTETTAKNNFDRAVAYVLSRVVGRE
jgi:F0F1-type ATP synthase membrane subunit b/b'